jgi:hypothetical protein
VIGCGLAHAAAHLSRLEILPLEGASGTLRCSLYWGRRRGKGAVRFSVPALRDQCPTYEDPAFTGRFDGGQEIATGVRLDHVTARAGAEGSLGHSDRIVLAHEHNSRFRGKLANSVSSFKTTDSRETDVQQDNVGMQVARFLDGFFSVSRFGHDLKVWIGAKHRSNAAPGHFVIIYD